MPVVDWTGVPADLNGLVLFAERRNLVSARVPSHFRRSLLTEPITEYPVFIERKIGSPCSYKRHDSCESSSYTSFPCNVCPAPRWPPLPRLWTKICSVCFVSLTHATPSFDQHNNTWHNMLVIPFIMTKWNVVRTKRPLGRPRCKWKGRICTFNTILRHVHCFAWNIRRMFEAAMFCSRRMFFYLLASALFTVQENCEITFYIACTCLT